MKILHYSDHANHDLPLLLPQADVMFTTGDLTIFDFADIRDRIHDKPSFGVYGNHDNPGYLDILGIKNVHLQLVPFQGMTIGGYEGCPRYKPGGGPQYTEEEAHRDLATYSRVDILLLHAAPLGLLDTPGDPVHTGSQAVRDYVERTRPKYIFCGHDSPNQEMEYLGIKIYRTDNARFIDIE